MDILSKIKSKNFNSIFYIGSIKIIDILFGIITYSKILKIFKPSLFGEYLYYLAFFQLLVPIVNLGLDISGVKILNGINDVKFKFEFFFGTLFFRILGLVLVTLLLFLGCRLFNINNIWLLIFSTWPLFWNISFSTWFFQSINKEKIFFFIVLFVKTLYLIFVFVYLNEDTNLYMIPLANILMSALLIFIYCTYFYLNGISLKPSGLTYLFKILKGENSIYSSQIFISFYTNINRIIIGKFLSYNDVVIFDFIDKVFNLLKQPFSVIHQSLFPRYLESPTNIFSTKIYKWTNVINTLLILITITASNYIINLLGGKNLLNLNAKDYLILYLPLLIIVGLSGFVGTFNLISNGKIKSYRNSVFLGLTVFIISVSLLITLTNYNLTLHLFSIYASEITILISFLYFKNENINNNIRPSSGS